jgi:hypothetical protein
MSCAAQLRVGGRTSDTSISEVGQTFASQARPDNGGTAPGNRKSRNEAGTPVGFDPSCSGHCSVSVRRSGAITESDRPAGGHASDHKQ